MRRTVIFGIFALAVMTAFSALSAYGQGSVAYPLGGRVLFTINLPYEVDAAGVLIPPGEYVIRDMGVPSQNLLSISCRDQFEAVALLHTVRRPLIAGREEADNPKLVFNEENTARPILRAIVVPGLDDYIVVAAVAKADSNCAVAQQAETSLTIKQTVIREETPPAPVVTPPPAPEPAPEVKQPEPAPQPEPTPPPVQERKRVRKQ